MLGIDGTTCFGGESVPEARFFVATALRASGLIDMDETLDLGTNL